MLHARMHSWWRSMVFSSCMPPLLQFSPITASLYACADAHALLQGRIACLPRAASHADTPSLMHQRGLQRLARLLVVSSQAHIDPSTPLRCHPAHAHPALAQAMQAHQRARMCCGTHTCTRSRQSDAAGPPCNSPSASHARQALPAPAHAFGVALTAHSYTSCVH